jgi:hypothetical protein
MNTIDVQAAGLTLTTGESYGLDPARAIVLTVLEGWDGGGSFRRSSTARLGGHGDYAERGWKGAKIISVQGDAVFDTRQEAARFVLELEATLADGRAGRLTVVDEDLGLTRWQDVYLTAGAKITRTGTDVEFIFDTVAPDPFKRGDETETTAAQDTAATVTTTGTADADQLFEITGYFPDGFTITEATTQNRLTFTGSIDSGADPVTIDASTGKVTHAASGDISRRLPVRQWTTLGPGQEAKYTLTAAGAAGGALTVRQTPKWH